MCRTKFNLGRYIAQVRDVVFTAQVTSQLLLEEFIEAALNVSEGFVCKEESG